MKYEQVEEYSIHIERHTFPNSAMPSEQLRTDDMKQWLNCWNPKSVFMQLFSLRLDSVIGENAPILIIGAAYIIAEYALHAFWGVRNKFVLIPYNAFFAHVAVCFSAVFICFHIPKKSYRLYLTPRYIGGFLMILIMAPLFVSAFSSYKQAFPLIHNFSFDYELMRLDYFLHFGHHPWRLLEFILSRPIILIILDRLYMLWFLFLFLFCLCMAWSKRRRLRLRFFVSTLLVWILLGSGLATVFSSAGPCYYSAAVNTTNNPFVPLATKLAEIHDDTFLFALNNHRGLWEAKLSGHWHLFGGISAMPSIHLAMATLFFLLAFSYHRWLGIAFFIYLCLIQIGSVILGWHYAIDGYAGIILAYIIWIGVKRLPYINT
jgi:membrane-associated phospholipid phosphatase